MNEPKQYSFANEDERIATMEKYEADGGADVSEINRMMEAPVATPDPAPAEHFEEEPAPAAAAPAAAPVEPAPVAPFAGAAPAAAPAMTAEEKLNRNWQVTEEQIPKDTYFDKKEGKVRPFITHKDPADLFKTVIHGQKRIHYLEDVLLPQTEQAVAARFQADMDRLKAENEQLKRAPLSQAPVPAAPAAPVAPAPAAATPAPATNLTDAHAQLAAAMKDLDGIQEGDSFNHTDKLQKGLVAALATINALTHQVQATDQRAVLASTKAEQLEQVRTAEAEGRRQQAEQDRVKTEWSKACSLIDSFATNNQDFKSEYGTPGQSFDGMTKDAINFHINLASLLFKAHPQQITNEQQLAASEAYLRGDNQELKQAIQLYGLEEPKNYRAWMELDQVDAMRTGGYRDPVTKRWAQIQDPVTRKPVMLGDMDTAYGRFLDVSGKRALKQQALLKRDRESLTNAATRRDGKLVSMDTNRMHGDATGSDLSEQQAVSICETIDSGDAVGEFYRSGNREKLDYLNRALARLGQPAIRVEEFTPAPQKKN